MKNLKKLTKNELKMVSGGMKHTDARSCNVIDRRPGAEAEWIQEVRNWWCNL